jgi:hypothetical protein
LDADRSTCGDGVPDIGGVKGDGYLRQVTPNLPV